MPLFPNGDRDHHLGVDPGRTHHLHQAIIDEFASRYDLYEAPLDDETLALAKELAPEHIAPE